MRRITTAHERGRLGGLSGAVAKPRAGWLVASLSMVLAACSPAIDIDSLPKAAAQPQRIVGIWEGTIDAVDLTIVVRVTQDGRALAATVDSPDQGAHGIPVDDVRFDGERFALRIESLAAAYSGVIAEAGKLDGEWHQGVAMDLDLAKVDAPTGRLRPQTPQPPFPYTVEDVTLPGGAPDVVLAGTLTLPAQAAFPSVVLVSGSGPQDRDETLFGHKPFLVLADYLARHGVGVLRYDDRGFGASTGDLASAVTSDFAADAAAAVAWLKGRAGIDPARVGVIGHSEGGLVAARLAAGEAGLACAVMLGGPAVSGEAVHQRQIRLVLEAGSTPLFDSTIEKFAGLQAALYEAARAPGTWAERRAEGQRRYAVALDGFNVLERTLLGLDAEDSALVEAIVSPWFLEFLNYDPRRHLASAKAPILALYGERDLQVPPAQSTPVLHDLNAQTGAIDVQVLPGLNHLFQTAETGSPEEYARIDETMAPAALAAIGGWVAENC